jgi:hypothetical protein
LDLIVEVAPLVVADEMRADVFVAGTFRRLSLVLEAVKECLCDILLEIDPGKLADHFRAKVFGKPVLADAEHIQPDAIV